MNSDSLVKCSIVIRCYNEEKHIGRLLSGIMQQTIKDVEIILVDSGSTDATLSIASRYPVKVISIKPEEFSFGRSLNIGCDAAEGEFIVIASGHVYPVYNDWLENIVKPFADNQVALVYGKQRGGKYTKYSEHQIFRKWFPEDSNSIQDHPFCNNANAAIRRRLWNELAYNESLTGLEDLDWAKRIMAKGYHIAYSAEAEIIHVHNENFPHIYNRYKREGMAHKQIFPEQSFTLLDFLKTFIANAAVDFYHAWRDMIFQDSLSIPLFRLMQFWGAYRGFAKSGRITDRLKKRFYYPNSFRRIKNKNYDDSQEGRRIDYAKIEKDSYSGKYH